MGTVYKRGNIWWIQYYRNGKGYQESSRSKKKMVAQGLLKQREGDVAQGRLPGIRFDRVWFEELIEGFIADYEHKDQDRPRVKNLKEYFKDFKAVDISTVMIKKYIKHRREWACKKCKNRFDAQDKCPLCGSDDLKSGAANGTINRELAAIKRMFSLARQETPPKVAEVPYIPMLKENNIRQGFFEHGDYIALRDALPFYLKGFATFAYKTGWRVSEIRNLTWNKVDLDNGIVRLEVGETKNDEARTIYLDDELKEVFQQQWESRKESKTLTPYVFPNTDGNGQIKDFRGAWEAACNDAEIGRRLFHDFRRTAVRNMVRAGIPEGVAMRVSGHKTRSIFERYNIVSDSDLKLAAQKQEEYLKAQTVTKTVTIADFQEKRANHDSG